MADLFAEDGRTDRVVRRGLGFGGSIGAILLFCLSLTPSLLPRHWLLQGVVSGITLAIGYGAGAVVGAAARAVWPRLPAPSRTAWAALTVAGGALAMLFLWLGDSWQREVRQLIAAEAVTAWDPLLIAAVAVDVFLLLLIVARLIRLATRRLTDTFGRFTPRPVASIAALGVVAALSYGLGPGVAFTGFVDVADRVAAQANRAIAPDQARPDSPYVSGGPGSLVDWRTLGSPGREFIAGAVREPLLSSVAGEATPPIRVYVGRDSAATVPQRAALAVQELERTGAFSREVLAVVTTTGTGWVNPVVADSLELMHGGDTAVVAMQYSFLPSWISFAADRSTATEAAEALIGAVHQRLDELPADQRPQLVVYGESLGAHGIESAAGGLPELLSTTDGALLVGSPHSSPIRQAVTDGRDPGSPMWRPVYQDAERVRFAQDPDDLAGPQAPDLPDVIYLQNASDPIVWWSPGLLYQRPDWLDGDRGQDVSGAMRWYPVVTFWQVTVDLVTSTKVPPGHGHSYGASVVDAWAALVPPEDWSEADTARVRAALPLPGRS